MLASELHLEIAIESVGASKNSFQQFQTIILQDAI